MPDIELVELGRVIITFGLPCQSIKDIRIQEAANEHGRLQIRMLSKNKFQETELLSLEDAPITVQQPDGAIIFDGICVGIGTDNLLDYTEYIVSASSKSILADREPKTKTFQSESKTLAQLAETALAPYGISVSVNKDVPIPEMLSQEDETDWAFIRRIANQYGNVVFADSKSRGNQIHIGPLPFSVKELGDVLHQSVERDLVEFSKVQGNLSPDASAFEFESKILVVHQD